MNTVFINVYKRDKSGFILIDCFVSNAEQAIHVIEKNYPKYIQEKADIRIEIEYD